MIHNWQDVVTGTVYKPVDDEHHAYFAKWARFVPTSEEPAAPAPEENDDPGPDDPGPDGDQNTTDPDVPAADAADASTVADPPEPAPEPAPAGRGKRGAASGG